MIIADPIYNIIEIPDELEVLIDTPVVQRLRRIRQLSFAYLVYPSANHTRFEHSLGVAYLAGKFAEKLGEDKLFYQICGLLHDVGHGPFSHAFEEVLMILENKDHEDLAEYWIKQVKDIISDLGYNHKSVLKEIKGKGLGIVASELDADRLDYLQRDVHHTGNYFGKINVWYLLNNVIKVDNKIAFKEKAVPNIENILIARGLMYKTVYLHKTTVAASLLFIDAVFKLIEKGYDVIELAKLDDSRLISLFLKENIEEWERIENRDLPKLLIEIPIEKFEEINYKIVSEIRKEIENLGIKAYIWPLEFREKRKIWKVKIYSKGELTTLAKVSKVSSYLNYLERSARNFRIYVDKEYKKEDVKEKIMKVLNNYLK